MYQLVLRTIEFLTEQKQANATRNAQNGDGSSDDPPVEEVNNTWMYCRSSSAQACEGNKLKNGDSRRLRTILETVFVLL